MRVLFADDEEDSRLVVKSQLESLGHVVDLAADGDEALEQARRIRPDVIITDILMPNVDGYDLCRIVKNDEDLHSIPVIFYTATFVESEDQTLAEKMGGSGFVTKPEEEGELIAAIEKAYRKNLDGSPGLKKLAKADQAALMEAHHARLKAKLDKRIREVEKERDSRAREQQRFKDFADVSADWFWETDKDYRITFVSGRFADLFELDINEVIGRTPWDLIVDLSRDTASSEDLKRRMQARYAFRSLQFHFTDQAGQTVYFSLNGKPLFGTTGGFEGYRGTGADETLRMTAQQEAEAAQIQLDEAISCAGVSIVIFDAKDRIVFKHLKPDESKPIFDKFGKLGETFENSLREIVAGGLYELGKRSVEEYIAWRLEGHGKPENTVELQRSDGGWYQLTERKMPNGGSIQVLTDTTRLKDSEAQLRQSQKLKTVGRLTGGVAHDFNNLLAVIMMNGEFLEDVLEASDSDAQNSVAGILKAATRGAELSHRLLAFSRSQTLQPRSINLNDIVVESIELLRPTLGESVDISFKPAEGLWNCEADPGELENALLNLAVNARDAMPDGGFLTIETANADIDEAYADSEAELSPGEYVMVSVSDNGYGMSGQVLENAFEPFFTTKDIGQGSGLGLSMVFGFIKQSLGHIAVYSEEGRGTTVKIYLPKSTRSVEQQASRGIEGIALGSGERILVVEDDPDLCALVVTFLDQLGYVATSTPDGPAAAELLQQDCAFDLLLTDLILPRGMTGAALGEKARALCPNIKLLYMSGFTENVADRLDESIELLNKPFTKRQLSQQIRKTLEH